MDLPTPKLAPSEDRSRTSQLVSVLTGVFWVIVVVVPTGFGLWAWRNLTGLSNSTNCQSAWSALESSTRLYCAETIAGDETPDELRQALQLLVTIPVNDPLYPTAVRLMGQWSNQLLETAENLFQEGELERAIELAEAVPYDTPVHKKANEQITRWRSIWSKAEEIYRDVEFELEQPDSDLEKWSRATTKARRLWTVGNQYWATTRYQELAEQIWRPDDQKKKVAKSSPKPQIATVEDLMAQRNKERQQENLAYLAKARSLANTGTLENLQNAISEANQVFSDGAEYEEAQRLIQVWRQQVEVLEDQVYLERAVALASKGDAASLQAAIDEARWITSGRPLYREAGERIEQWNAQLIQLQNSSYPPRQAPTPMAPSLSRPTYPVEPLSSPSPEPDPSAPPSP